MENEAFLRYPRGLEGERAGSALKEAPKAGVTEGVTNLTRTALGSNGAIEAARVGFAQ